MKANHTYESVIKSKLDQLNGPDADIMWGDMKGILDIHMPQKKKRRFIGWWFFDGGSGMYLGIAILITLGSLTGYRILKNKENLSISSSETQSSQKSVDKNVSTGGDKTNGDNLSSGVSASTKSQKTGDITDKNVEENKNVSVNSENKSNKDIITRSGLQYNSATVNSKNRIAVSNKTMQSSVQSESTGTWKKDEAVSIYQTGSFSSLPTMKTATMNLSITENADKTTAEDIIAKLKNKPRTKGWVIGGSFNYHMPVNSQVMSNVNANGKKGNLVDYLPSLYVQYHLNEKWYLQSEIQYSSPQYTPNHILFDEWSNMNTHQKEQNLVYLDKLYYLSIPVTIHYSPLKNVQVGAGLQFSQMVKSILPDEHAVWQNGMTGWQKTIVDKKIYSTSPRSKSKKATTPARIDTVSQNFKSSDLRMVIDANYNVGKMNIGFTFNMGLSNYMNLKAGTNSVLIKDRNEDLKIYLKYKLWDQRRKKSNP